MQRYSVISGDLVGYTSLNSSGRKFIEKEINHFLNEWQNKLISYSRLIKGDYLEMVCKSPENALRLALLMKCFVKGVNLPAEYFQDTHRRKYFEEHGIRLAIGLGPLDTLDIPEGRIDGEAMFRAGRLINSQKTFEKERIVIKNTLFFESDSDEMNKQMKVILELLDFIIAQATARQCQIIFHKLTGKSELEIASHDEITQSAVNRHSVRAGWNAIETAVLYFEDQLK